MGIAGQEGSIGPVWPGTHHFAPLPSQQSEQMQLDSSTPVKEDQPATRTQDQQNILLTGLHGGLSKSNFSALSLFRPLFLFSSAPQLFSLTGVGVLSTISNKELRMEDNAATRTSLPLSVAHSNLPFRMIKSDLPTPTSLFQSPPAFSICTSLYSDMCFNWSLLLVCVHLFCCPVWMSTMKGDFSAFSEQACCLMVPGATLDCRAPPGEK